MAKEIPSEDNEAEQQPVGGGNTKMSSHGGLPHKQTGEKMPHEHFQKKMSDKLAGC